MEFLLEHAPHLIGLVPVIRRARIGLTQRADEGSIFDAGCIRRMASGKKTIGMEFWIKPHERLGLDELLSEPIPFLLSAIAKHDPLGLAHRSHLAYPLIESGIRAIEGEFL
jgi:hypothetical protein